MKVCLSPRSMRLDWAPHLCTTTGSDMPTGRARPMGPFPGNSQLHLPKCTTPCTSLLILYLYPKSLVDNAIVPSIEYAAYSLYCEAICIIFITRVPTEISGLSCHSVQDASCLCSTGWDTWQEQGVTTPPSSITWESLRWTFRTHTTGYERLTRFFLIYSPKCEGCGSQSQSVVKGLCLVHWFQNKTLFPPNWIYGYFFFIQSKTNARIYPAYHTAYDTFDYASKFIDPGEQWHNTHI